MIDADSAKVKAEALRKKWEKIGGRHRVPAIEKIRSAFKEMDNQERSRALASLNSIRRHHGEIELRNDEENLDYGPLKNQLRNLENSGNRIFVPFIVWLRYFYSDLAASFLDDVFEPGGWDFPPISECRSWPERPLIASPTVKYSELSLPLDLMAIRNSLVETQVELLDQAVPNRLVDDFKSLVAQGPSGAWCLTAGPGTGKSVLMASLARDLARTGLCISYYFRWSQEASFSEKRREFFDYVLGVVRTAYSIPNSEIGEISSSQVAFFEILKRLSEQKKVSKESPIIFVIDGLDEMGAGFRYSDPNPLSIPDALSEGVFIAYSMRRQKGDESWAWSPPKSHARLHINPTNLKLKEALTEFIDRAIDKKSYLQEFVSGQSGPSFNDKKEEFCNGLLDVAKHNFMFIRCVLYDPSYWNRDALKNIRSTETLDDYYANHLERMTKGEMYGLNARAAFCFGFTTELSRFAFLEMLKSDNTPSAFEKASELLDQWYEQGLLVKASHEGEIWYKPYHRTFREYLAKETKLTGDKEFFAPLADAITRKEIDDELILDFLPDTLKCKTEWVNLTLSLLVRANMPTRLGRFLVSLNMWKLAAAGYDGIGVVFQCLKLVRAQERSYSVYRSNMEKCARELIAWTAQKKIHDNSGKALSISQVSEISEASRVGISNRASTLHLNFAQVLFEVRSTT